MLIEKSKSNPSFDALFALIQVLNIPADRIFRPENSHLEQEVQELMRVFRVCEPGDRSGPGTGPPLQPQPCIAFMQYLVIAREPQKPTKGTPCPVTELTGKQIDKIQRANQIRQETASKGTPASRRQDGRFLGWEV